MESRLLSVECCNRNNSEILLSRSSHDSEINYNSHQNVIRAITEIKTKLNGDTEGKTIS